MANKYFLKGSISLAIRKLYIKTARESLIPCKMPVIKKQNTKQMKNQKTLAKMWGKRNPYALLVGVNAGTVIRQPMWRSYKKS